MSQELTNLIATFGKDVIGPFRDEYAFLSNFYNITGGMKFAGLLVPTSEHAFQMMKTLDLRDRAWIAACPTAADAKRAGSAEGLNGRKIELRSDWELVRAEVMRQVVRAKFIQDFGLAKKLLATGNFRLVELNWWNDTTWGWCMKTDKGSNMLGFILEKIRAELKLLSRKDYRCL